MEQIAQSIKNEGFNPFKFKNNPDDIYTLHSHPETKLIVVLNGNIKVIVDENVFDCKVGPCHKIKFVPSNFNKIYLLTQKIPRGKVTTYKALAKAGGIKNPRLVGWILHRNPDPSKYPCHRVVSSFGSLAKAYAYGGLKAQTKKLQQEGVVVKNHKVDLAKYFSVFN